MRYFVRNPHSHCEKGFEVMPATSEIVAQFGALLGEISHAAEDDSITNEESEAIRKVWESLKGYTEGFVSCCEEGDFEKIRQLRQAVASCPDCSRQVLTGG